MIGQFGVGFYSAYLVAKTVTVISKNRDDDEYMWYSTAGGSFNITPSSTGLKRGTRIILEIKNGCESFLKHQKIYDLVETYSKFIGFKISLLTDKETEEEVTDDEGEEECKVEVVKKTNVKNGESGELSLIHI